MKVKIRRDEDPRSTNRIVIETESGELRLIEEHGNIRVWFTDGEDDHEMAIKPASGNEFLIKFYQK